MVENELLKVSQDLSNRLFWNEFWLRSIARHRTYRGQQVRADVRQGNRPVLVIAGLIELVFWIVVAIVLGGTMLMSLCGLMMIVFGIE